MAQLADDCFAFGGRLIRLDEASALLGEQFARVVPAETVPLSAAGGRVLAADIVAPISVPPLTNSAVDGYAVNFDDLSATQETRLPICGRAAAGHPLGASLPRGAAARIFTGAVMPDGADTVMMQEDCTATSSEVCLRPGIGRGANRRLAGEDVQAGRTVLRAGHRLGPPEVGLLSAVGLVGVAVQSKLRLALFSTGDEVAEAGHTLAPGQIYDSNRPMVADLLHRAGASVTDGGILPDREDALRDAFADAARHHDLIITSGGVSVGDEDHVRGAIERIGALSFWRLGIKPGRPVALGTIGAVPLVGLPGNPVAAMVTYMAIARPLIALLAGETVRPPWRFTVASGFAHRKKRDRREYLRVRLEYGADGLIARLFPRDGAGILTSLTESDALAELPEAMTELAPGQPVSCIPLRLIYD